MPSSRRTFENFFKIPFSYRLKAFFFFSFRELPSDQENKNGLAAKLLWFLGHRVSVDDVSTLKFRTAGKGIKNSECPAVRKCSKISAKFLSFSNRLKVFYIHLE